MLVNFKTTAATNKATMVEVMTPAQTGNKPPFGAIAVNAMMEPGDGAATNPAPSKVKVATHVRPPAMTDNNSKGFIKTYGK